MLQAERLSIRLNPAAVTTDAAEFEATLEEAARASSPAERAQQLSDAVEQYRGPFLPGYYSDWALGEQERLAGQFLQAVLRLARLREELGDLDGALQAARRGVAADTLREEAHRELIRLLLAAGQPAEARRQYAELERVLEVELGTSPSQATRALLGAHEAWEAREQRSKGARETRRSDAPVGTAPAPLRPGSLAAHGQSPLPTGTVSFLLSDVEESTAKWEAARDQETYRAALAAHRELLRREFRRHGGHEVKEAGDEFIVAFSAARDALDCAIASPQALARHAWSEETGPVRVRMAVHSGDIEFEEGEYRGLLLHRAARIRSAAHGGQLVCSEASANLLRRDLQGDVRLRDLGIFRLRGVPAPERLFQVDYPGMPRDSFPPLKAEAGYGGSVPPQFSRFFGRQGELERLRELLDPGRQGSKGAGEQGGREGGIVGSSPAALPPCRLAAADDTRLVTLTGPGGTGKTRLAIEAAQQLVPAFSGAVWFVPLGDVSDARRVPDAAAAVMRLPAAPATEPLDQVVEALGRQPALLVLDNFEQLVGDGARIVRDLLERAPTLRCIVTSRQRLDISGEREFQVLPLPRPEGGNGARWAPERLTLFESVQLFIDRAQTVKPDFQVTNANAPYVAELCERLEGIPLAIELAAARAQVLTPAQMLQQLARRYDFLVSRKRDAPERQRTLRSAVDWSYQLLSPELQRFWTRLSVFRGGWTLEAAEAVCGASGVMERVPAKRAASGGAGARGAAGGNPERPESNTPTLHHSTTPSAPDALDQLAQLRECSLVQTEETEEAVRFRMLETLREYAAEQLRPEEREPVRMSHADYFVRLAEEAESQLRGPEQADWLRRLDRERLNFREALSGIADCPDGLTPGPPPTAWAPAQTSWRGGTEVPAPARVSGAGGTLPLGSAPPGGDVPSVPPLHEVCGEGPGVRPPQSAIGLRLAAALWRWWSVRGYTSEGLAALTGVLARAPESDAELGRSAWRAHALEGAGALAHDRSDYSAAARCLDEAIGNWRGLADEAGLAGAVNSRANVAFEQREYERARALYEEALALHRRARDVRGTAMVLSNMGELAREQADLARAAALLAESLQLRRPLGDRYGLAISLENLGNVERDQGNLDRARPFHEEALELRRELGHRQGIAVSLNNLGHLLLAQQDPGAAACFTESRSLLLELDDQRSLAECCSGLAAVAAREGDHHRAARFLGAAAALRESLGIEPSPAESAAETEVETAARAALGDAAFETALELGKAVPPE